jgi:2-(1,2-epoxy-1,2-dihydrophenyl)acetyl-CoA isomerase
MGQSGRIIPNWLQRGASPDSGGSYFLSRLLGPGAMVAMMIAGREIDAPQALSLMLIQEVVPDGLATERALELAEELSTLSAASLRAVRELGDQATTHDLASHLRLEVEMLRQVRTSEGRRTALSAWAAEHKQAAT